MFHLFTHAWFKALLFLGSGAVIYACHHEQNIWKMGGLRTKCPSPSVTLASEPSLSADSHFTAGFFSKEQILEAALHTKMALFRIAALVACLTTFYMFRLFFIAFLGKNRSEKADHAKEVGALMLIPSAFLAVMALFQVGTQSAQ